MDVHSLLPKSPPSKQTIFFTPASARASISISSEERRMLSLEVSCRHGLDNGRWSALVKVSVELVDAECAPGDALHQTRDVTCPL